MKNIILLTVLVIILSTSLVFGQEATINAVCIQGLKNGTTDTLIAGSQIIIDLIYTNGYDCRQNINNLFKLSSPDSATWSNIDFDCYYKPGMELMTFESFIWNPPLYPWVGISPDYFLTYYSTVFGPGWVTGPTYGYTGPMPWSYPTFYLTFYLDQDQAGKHLVLDSMTGTGSNWVWSQLACGNGITLNIHPDWGGPYEFYIKESCCSGTVGNADCSELEEPDMSDFVRVIDYLYISHKPLCCPEEADFDGSGDPEPDISDLTYLWRHLYIDHPALPDCQ
ncbi:MAG: hypothetical protein PHU88_11625 [candidate division Zixibacteria bacterium]|nr:hypothetical protein [candidate division Zixibacteria bacterium]MDD5425676.1 hypothetical protein [candidate division Zixibacteria bacterium]